MERYQRLMIFNGLLLIKVARLGGFMLMFNLIACRAGASNIVFEMLDKR